MQQQLLLLEDVIGLGRKGDIVRAKRGFIRNFLLPQKKALIATAQALKIQVQLKEEREKQAVIDKKESEVLAKIIDDKVLEVHVKVDPAGHMYGSVSALDIVKLLEQEGATIERHNVLLPQAIKATGTHKIDLRLKEGVVASFTLKVTPEGVIPVVAPEVQAPEKEEA